MEIPLHQMNTEPSENFSLIIARITLTIFTLYLHSTPLTFRVPYQKCDNLAAVSLEMVLVLEFVIQMTCAATSQGTILRCVSPSNSRVT